MHSAKGARSPEDQIMELLGSLAAHSYGEQFDMLTHSLQAAAGAEASGAGDALVLAALLHDVGHLCGDATEWGLPSHAEVGARFLRPWLDANVVEPIRLHVDAKRYLVATDSEYVKHLSGASVATLHQQGGPFDVEEVAAFEQEPYAAEAVLVRRWDDGGKQAELATRPLEDYRPLVAAALEDASVDAAWARDSCRCGECRDPQTGQHLIGAADLGGWTVDGQSRSDAELVVDLVHVNGGTHRCHIPTARVGAPGERTFWRAGHADRLRADCGSIEMFARELSASGIALIDGLGSEEGEVLKFARSIGYVRSTNYGDLFDVIATETPNNLAFTSLGLPLHTDNPYRDPVPTAQLLHCLRSAELGGGSIFSDGFAAAEEFRSVDPQAFALLSSTPVSFSFTDADVALRADVPIIELDGRGALRRVAVNHRSMEPPSPGPSSGAFYDAYIRFNELLSSDEFVISLDLRPGQLIGFDNRRVLHGRSEFGTGGSRHLQGCYIDMDAVDSLARRRVEPLTR